MEFVLDWRRWRAGKVSVNSATALVVKITAAHWRQGEKHEEPHKFVRRIPAADKQKNR